MVDLHQAERMVNRSVAAVATRSERQHLVRTKQGFAAVRFAERLAVVERQAVGSLVAEWAAEARHLVEEANCLATKRHVALHQFHHRTDSQS